MIERLRKVALWIDDRVYISKIFAATRAIRFRAPRAVGFTSSVAAPCSAS